MAMKRIANRATPFALSILALAIAAPGSTRAQTPPPQAAAAGYKKRTFSSSFTKAEVDLANTMRPGFQWYRNRFFGFGPAPGVTLNLDGSVTLANNSGANMGISTACTTQDGRWVGKVFGGGAYFEAVLKFDPKTVDARVGCPAWWALAIEHAADLPTVHWDGQAPGYRHYIEPDFFEYDVPDYGNPPGKSYGGAVHDWSGIYPDMINKTQPWPGQVITTPRRTDFTKYHKYGFLWVPATATARGYGKYYFDDRPMAGGVSWARFENQKPTAPDSMDPWTYGIIDQQHLALILGSGGPAPMTVQSVSVWQKSAAQNGRDGRLP